MAACAALVIPGGRSVFRHAQESTNGAYFSAVRRHMLKHMTDAMHVFESREEHFTDDGCTPEAMITWATAQFTGPGQVMISTSAGMSDLPSAVLRSLLLRT